MDRVGENEEREGWNIGRMADAIQANHGSPLHHGRYSYVWWFGVSLDYQWALRSAAAGSLYHPD